MVWGNGNGHHSIVCEVEEGEEGNEEEPEEHVEIIGTVHCEKNALNIRDGIRGKVISTARRGEDVELVGFIDGIQSDGYQWVKCRYKNYVGYAQFDSNVLWVKLKESEETI